MSNKTYIVTQEAQTPVQHHRSTIKWLLDDLLHSNSFYLHHACLAGSPVTHLYANPIQFHVWSKFSVLDENHVCSFDNSIALTRVVAFHHTILCSLLHTSVWTEVLLIQPQNGCCSQRCTNLILFPYTLPWVKHSICLNQSFLKPFLKRNFHKVLPPTFTPK